MVFTLLQANTNKYLALIEVDCSFTNEDSYMTRRNGRREMYTLFHIVMSSPVVYPDLQKPCSPAFKRLSEPNFPEDLCVSLVV